MSSAKEIRTQINTIKNTKKITRAMEMVAASKMRKAQERMQMSRPYAERVRDMISHVAKSHSEYHHPFMVAREEKSVGLIIASTDRGLCGGLNNNLFRLVVQQMTTWRDAKTPIDLCLIGRKSHAFFKRYGGNIVGHASQLGDEPTVDQLIGVVKVMLDAYHKGEIDALYLAHNQFVNTMTQTPQIEKLLPIAPTDEKSLDYYWDYIYEPDPKEILDQLLTRYIESQVYQGVVENIACEQAARMVSMKNATENATGLIDDLSLVYNKARQASITQELSEIVGGAAAL